LTVALGIAHISLFWQQLYSSQFQLLFTTWLRPYQRLFHGPIPVPSQPIRSEKCVQFISFPITSPNWSMEQWWYWTYYSLHCSRFALFIQINFTEPRSIC